MQATGYTRHAGGLSVTLTKDASVDGKEHYRRIYNERMGDEARWLAYGAQAKADSVEQLLRRNGLKPQSLLELGAGTGAVIAECKRRSLAQEFLAVDYAESAVAHLRETVPGIEAQVADIAAPGFSLGRHFDVVVVSHVIEHLEDPDTFLAGVVRMDFDVAVFEVPLEDLAASRLKARLRDRLANTAGHVQFFTSTSFESLLRNHGFEVLDRRRYIPVVSVEMLRFQQRRNGYGLLKFVQTVVTANILPRLLGPLWSRVYYAHYATLCRKRGAGSAAGRPAGGAEFGNQR